MNTRFANAENLFISCLAVFDPKNWSTKMMYQKIADINLFHNTDSQAHHLQQVMDTEINSRPSEKFTLVVYNKLCAYCYRKFETVN